MELSIGTIIKIIIGLFVIVAVVYGVYKAVTGSILDVFKNWNVSSTKFVLSLIK